MSLATPAERLQQRQARWQRWGAELAARTTPRPVLESEGRLLRVTVADRLGVVDAPIVPDEGLNQEPSDASRYNQTPAGTTNQVHSRTR